VRRLRSSFGGSEELDDCDDDAGEDEPEPLESPLSLFVLLLPLSSTGLKRNVKLL
jgi:hypothetical protein